MEDADPMTIREDTLNDWSELSKRDDCMNRLVPSDIRLMLGEIDRLRAEISWLKREHIPRPSIAEMRAMLDEPNETQ